MHSKLLAESKARLIAKKQELIETILQLEDDGLRSALANTTGELSSYDNHPADLGSETFERSKDVGLRDNERVLLSNVEHALEKIHQGTYGRCDRCGSQISQERLAALPWATQCIECQQQVDQNAVTPRPLEEIILTPPFKKNFLDSASCDFVGYDGEDALQEVMRYGSSDTPQDVPGAKDYESVFLNSDEHHGIVELTDAIPIEPGSTGRHASRRQRHEKQTRQ